MKSMTIQELITEGTKLYLEDSDSYLKILGVNNEHEREVDTIVITHKHSFHSSISLGALYNICLQNNINLFN